MQNTNKASQSTSDYVDQSVAPVAYVIGLLLFLLVTAYSFFRDVPIFFGHALEEFEFIAPLLGIASFCFYVGLFLYGINRMKSFLAKHGEIGGKLALEEIKTVIRNQMKLVYPLLGSTLVVVICGVTLMRNFGGLGFAFMIAVLVINGILTARANKLIIKIRSLPVTDDELKMIYADLLIRWKKKLWPDF